MLDYRILDVFTDRPFAGNPLAVVPGADGLTDAQMQTLAREFNLSETIFVQAPADPAHTARVRIFLPRGELPFAGHPVIGCATMLAADLGLSRLVLETRAGPVPVSVEGGLAELTVPVVPHPHPGGTDAAGIAAALGLPPQAVGFGAHRPGLFAGGPAYLFVPLADLAALAAARPVEPGWSAAMAAGGVSMAFLYTPFGGGYRARMFAPGAGVPEDPATGSACAILAAQLLVAGALPPGRLVVDIVQGVEMGRESSIRLTVERDGAALRAVRIAGRAVEVAAGRILPPPA
jgi:trans-2,3-dihydro-3-hydroxyanthranilate isomerase